jgi:hypothetical protein
MLTRLLPAILLFASAAYADPPVISNVNVSRDGALWRFDVTISHADKGWDDYADAWRVVDGQGTELGLRELAHPHDGQQTFTRSLSGVRIPDDVTDVGVQVRDTVNGWYPDIKKVKLR